MYLFGSLWSKLSNNAWDKLPSNSWLVFQAVHYSRHYLWTGNHVSQLTISREIQSHIKSYAGNFLAGPEKEQVKNVVKRNGVGRSVSQNYTEVSGQGNLLTNTATRPGDKAMNRRYQGAWSRAWMMKVADC